MPRPRTIVPCDLLVYRDYNETEYVGDLRTLARNYKRDVRSLGGLWQGSFEIIDFSQEDAFSFFYNQLGNHFIERYGGIRTWEGLIYEVDLVWNGIRRRRSLDTMFNAFKGVWLGQERLRNTSFESPGAGGGDVFVNWSETVGDGSILQDDAVFYSGAYSCKLTAGASANTYVTQQTNVAAFENLDLSFYTRGDGTYAARYAVYDVTNSAYIIPVTSTGVSGTSWTKVDVPVTIPETCSVLRLELWCPAVSGGDGYFDLASLIVYEHVSETDWYTQDQSIARYGRKEEVLYMDGYLPSTAELQLQTALSEYSWPWARNISYSEASKAPVIEVKLCGYVFTMQWRFITVADGATGPVHLWIKDVVETDCPHIASNIITPNNSITVTRFTRQKVRAWDLIGELTGLGDADFNPWVSAVEVGRRFSYMELDKTPKYFYRDGEFYNDVGGSSKAEPWLMRPGVVRDLDYPIRKAEPGSMFEDARDFWLDELEIDWMGRIRPKSTYFEESEILASQLSRTTGGGG